MTNDDHIDDEELIHTRLNFSDPMGEPNILDAIPSGDELPVIIGSYEVRPEGGKKNPNFAETLVRCSHCRRTNHWNGYIARFRDGRGILLGGTCGSEHYGADFTRIERTFNARKERQFYLRAMKSIEGRIYSVISEVEELRNSAIVKRFHEMRKLANHKHQVVRTVVEYPDDEQNVITEFEDVRHFPYLSKTMATAVAEGGNLFIVNAVRDFEAEERAREKRAEKLADYDAMTTSAKKVYHKAHGRPNRNIPKKFKLERSELAALQGNELFNYAINPRGDLEQIHRRLKEIIGESGWHITKNKSTTALRDFTVQFRDMLKKLNEVIAWLGAPDAFFKPQNLAAVVECLNSELKRLQHDGSYAVEGNAIVFRRADGSGAHYSCGTAKLTKLALVAKLRSELAV